MLSPQNTANIALIPPMPHMQQQHMINVPVSGAPPVMVRSVDSAGNPSLPPNGGWSLQPNQQVQPHQMGGPPPHPPSAGTPNSNLVGQPQPPTSATPPTLQPPNNQNPHSGGHHLPQHMHPNGVAVSSPNVYANFIPGLFTFLKYLFTFLKYVFLFMKCVFLFLKYLFTFLKYLFAKCIRQLHSRYYNGRIFAYFDFCEKEAKMNTTYIFFAKNAKELKSVKIVERISENPLKKSQKN